MPTTSPGPTAHEPHTQQAARPHTLCDRHPASECRWTGSYWFCLDGLHLATGPGYYVAPALAS